MHTSQLSDLTDAKDIREMKDSLSVIAWEYILCKEEGISLQDLKNIYDLVFLLGKLEEEVSDG